MTNGIPFRASKAQPGQRAPLDQPERLEQRAPLVRQAQLAQPGQLD
jgi:hypothetical protein